MPLNFFVQRQCSMLMALALWLFVVGNSSAIILYDTDNALANTSAPTGIYAGSGWVYQGEYGGFLGTMIGEKYFITAQHFGLQGSTFVSTATFNGSANVTYTIDSAANGGQGYWDIAGTDFRILRINESFSSYAQLYMGSAEAGKTMVTFGRGGPRGAEVDLNGPVQGWYHTGSDGVSRWGANTVDAAGQTALMAAAEHDEAIVVATLLGAGADVKLRDLTGRTALATAVAAGADRAALALMAAGSIDVADNAGVTPLAMAAQRGDLMLVQRLLKANAQREAKSKTGNTPLLLAAGAGRADVVRELLDAGAKIEARNELGNTSLLAAVVGRQAATAKLLIARGADQRIRNSASMSAADLARQGGDPAIMALFSSAK